MEWDQKEHAEDYLLFPENIGKHLSIDELALSRGELYTFITNKAGSGKNGTLVASIKGTLSRKIISVLERIPLFKRCEVEEITLDMAVNMESAARHIFPCANLVTDRFHVVKLAIDALQHIRIKYRWEELDKENQAIDLCRKQKTQYKADRLINGDTAKQLLARCRYIIAKKPNEWTNSQKLRASLLFNRYPIIEKAYKHILEFRSIYEQRDQTMAEYMFKDWIYKTRELKIKEFNTVANTVQYNLDNILNFFINRSTNANAESFNSKIKLFRANQRGVTDHKFFLFRLKNLFA